MISTVQQREYSIYIKQKQLIKNEYQGWKMLCNFKSQYAFKTNICRDFSWTYYKQLQKFNLLGIRSSVHGYCQNYHKPKGFKPDKLLTRTSDKPLINFREKTLPSMFHENSK